VSQLGQDFDLPELPSPGELGEDEDWAACCERDATILEMTVLSLVNCVQSHGLGNFCGTVASQAMHAFRHRHLRHDILLGHSEECKSLERAAYYGGRRWVYFRGNVFPRAAEGIEGLIPSPKGLPRIFAGPVYHLDMVGAYPSVMLTNLYPTKLAKVEEEVPIAVLEKRLAAYTCVADVQLDSSNIAWPLRRKGEVWWCWGRYRTALAGADLVRAVEAGVVKQCFRLQSYCHAPIFTTFVEELWKLRRHFEEGGLPNMSRFVKTLLNSLHGKFAQRSHMWEIVPGRVAPLPWGTLWAVDDAKGTRETFRSIGWTLQRYFGQSEHPESFPAIAACVAADAREAVRRIRAVSAYQSVLYEDADSLHVTEIGYQVLRETGRIDPDRLGALRVEAVADTATYWGPCDYLHGERRVQVGLGSKATRDAKGVWHQTNFQRLDATIAGPPPEGPIATDFEPSQPLHPLRASCGSDGWTAPLYIKE